MCGEGCTFLVTSRTCIWHRFSIDRKSFFRPAGRKNDLQKDGTYHAAVHPEPASPEAPPEPVEGRVEGSKGRLKRRERKPKQSYAQRILHAPQRIDMILRRAQPSAHGIHAQVRSAQPTPAFDIARPLSLGHLADAQACLDAHR